MCASFISIKKYIYSGVYTSPVIVYAHSLSFYEFDSGINAITISIYVFSPTMSTLRFPNRRRRNPRKCLPQRFLRVRTRNPSCSLCQFHPKYVSSLFSYFCAIYN